MSKNSATPEKRRYWETRLESLLAPIPVLELIKLSWAVEAFRGNRIDASRRVATLPGDPSDHRIPGKYFIPPWSIDAVLNERLVIGASAKNEHRRLDLQTWGGIAKLFNTYSGLANVESVLDYDSTEVLPAMQRLFWPQYNWQLGFENLPRLAKAWFVYGSTEAQASFLQKYNIELVEFLRIAFALFAGTDQYPAVRESSLRPNFGGTGGIRKTLQILGGNLDQKSKLAREIRDSEIPRDFRRSVVKERPVFEVVSGTDFYFFVPSRESLLLRISDGLYFDTVGDSNARRRSGERFEELVAKLARHYFPEIEVSGEVDNSFGKSADAFLYHRDANQVTILECKARRLPLRVLTSPKPWEDCREDFADLAKGIVQIWRSHAELTEPMNLEAQGLLVLYDPWTLMGNSFVEELLAMADGLANDLGVSNAARVPIAITDFFDLERCFRKYEIAEIREAIVLANTKRFLGYALSNVCSEVADEHSKKIGFNYSELARDAVPWWGTE